MPWADKLGWALRGAGIAAALSGAAIVTGCGMPAAPQPPSLRLPNPVTDLSATRTGNQVSLTWTMPRRDTDKVMLKGNVAVRVCRRADDAATGKAASCETVADLVLAPQADGAFSETLPPALASGAPRGLTYFVELKNNKSRSAGLSNAAAVVAGEAPGPVDALRAEVRKDGVVLRWTPGAVETIRLNRKLVAAPAAKAQTASGQNTAAEPKAGDGRTGEGKTGQGLMATAPTPADENLLVEAGGPGGRAIDKQIQFGETYEYRAQRVARVLVNGKKVELDGLFSAPVRVEARDVFPPAVPTGLAAVASVGQNGGETAIDLSWQANTEADLAGYAVYRREEGANSGAWRRISPAQPVVGPGFHDTNVEGGHTYEYAVTAIDEGGHESGRSATTQETVPGP